MPQIVLAGGQHKRLLLKWGLIIGFGGAALAIGIVTVMNLVATQTYKGIVRQEQELEAAHNYGAETTALTRYVDSQPPQQYREAACLKLGDLAYNAGHYAQAAGWYFQVYQLEIHPNVRILVDLAKSAAGIGDKQTAISYYRHAVALTPKDKYGQLSAQAYQYEDQIQYLGGKP